MSAPLWAQRIITEICEEEGIEEPEIVWRRSRVQYWSSGNASKYRIVITAGTERKDQRLVLLHELVHVVRQNKHNDAVSHSAEFFADVFRLVWRYGPNIKWAKEREFSYRVAAKAGYKIYRQNVKEKGR